MWVLLCPVLKKTAADATMRTCCGDYIATLGRVEVHEVQQQTTAECELEAATALSCTQVWNISR